MTQNRSSPRFALEIDAEVTFQNRKIPVRTRDLSRGGLCFHASAAMPVGADLEMQVSLVFEEETFSEPLHIRTRVVWCTPIAATSFQVGTCFVGLTGEQRSYLDLFLRYLKEGQARHQAPEPAVDEDDVFSRK
jgi:hypothetical protein